MFNVWIEVRIEIEMGEILLIYFNFVFQHLKEGYAIFSLKLSLQQKTSIVVFSEEVVSHFAVCLMQLTHRFE
jgi:hypothetical protein